MKVPFFLARQPIVDENRNVVMYELFLRSEKSPDKFPQELPPYKAAFMVIDLLTSIGYNKIAGNKKVMINLSIQNALNKTYLETLVPEKTVLNLQKPYTELSEKQWEFISKALDSLKNEGFQFAFDIDLFTFKNIKVLALKYADYIVVDINQLSRINDTFLDRKTCIATKIETEEQFKKARDKSCDLFEGYLFGKPERISVELSFTALTTTVIKTLSALERNTDIKEIEELIKSDPGLVAKLLRFVNSSFFYLPIEIKSVRQTLAYLGINNLKKYLAVLLILELAETLKIPVEQYKKMLLAAVLSEILATKIKEDKDIAFLGALFYPSDIVFKVEPIKLAVELKLSHEILEAYLEDNPKLFCLFYITKKLAFDTDSYKNGFLHIEALKKDKKFSECLSSLGLSEKDLKEALTSAVEKVKNIII
jgi:EAL and modified HD-GYP domain-containing signal transduction protein